MRRVDSLEKTLMLGGIGGRRRRVGDRQGGLACCDSWGRKDSDMTKQLKTDTHTHTHTYSKDKCTKAIVALIQGLYIEMYSLLTVQGTCMGNG